MGKRKPNINSPRYKGDSKLPKFQPNKNEELYLAVGSGVRINNQQRKSKLYSENRQLTWNTDDFRDTGNFIKKITQRTNTKVSNFSEFPKPIKEKQVKLGRIKSSEQTKFRSRTVKRRNMGTSKLGKKKTPIKKNLKYYNIMTDIQKGKIKVSPNRLWWDFCNLEILRSNGANSDASHLAISKFGQTNTESLLSKDDVGYKNNLNNVCGRKQHSKKLKNKQGYQKLGYNKTDATRTDTKSFKQTYSRDNSISSGRSGGFSKKLSLNRKDNSNSRSTAKRKGNEYHDSDSTSSFDDNFSVSKGRIKNLHKLGIKNINSGFPEGIKEENEENTTKTKLSGNKLNNFSSLHKKRTEVEKKEGDREYLKPNLINKQQKIRKTLSDPSTIEQHVKSSGPKPKTRGKLLNKRQKNNYGRPFMNNDSAKKSTLSKGNMNKSKIMSKNSSISSITKAHDQDIINLVTTKKPGDGSNYYTRK